MKKILTVMMIMMIAAVSVFATSNPSSLAVTYDVEGFYSGAYTFRFNNEAEAETFSMGSNSGKIAASHLDDYFYIVDRSFCNKAEDYSCTITLGEPGVWTNTSDNGVTGSDVSITADSFQGINEGNVTTSVSGNVLTITYAAATTVDTVTKRNEANAQKDVAKFQLSWASSIVPVGTYKSTMTVTYAGI